MKRSAGYRVRKLYRIFKHPDIYKLCYVFVSAKAMYQMKKVQSSFQKFYNFFFGQFIIPFIENVSLTSVSLLPFLSASSSPFRTFPTIFWRVFFAKNIEKKRLCRHDKNYYYSWKSDIPVINLIVDSTNMIKVSKNMSL